MEVSVSTAKGQLTDLVRRAETGDEVVLTRHGQPAVRLVPVRPAINIKASRAVLEDIRRAAAAKIQPGAPTAARSQDFLYDEDGLPT